MRPRGSAVRFHLGLWIGALAVIAWASACNRPAGDGDSDRPRIAWVTNCVAEFWKIGELGARAAEHEFQVDVDVQMPASNDPQEQKQILEDVLTRGAVAVAISPIDPRNQTDMIDAAAARVPLFTHDSDAPNSKRLCYVGMDNYRAGRMCGALVRAACPDGGKVALFVGNLAQDNARLRRQGVIDALLGRSEDSSRYDAPDATLQGEGFEIVATLMDNTDQPQAKANAEDALNAHPDLACMVGLFEYNAPMCLEALRQAGRLGEVAVVAFDENRATLEGIRDGHVRGTIVQDPYRYGYDSVRLLAALVRGDRSVLPESGFYSIPARRIDAANVDQFAADLEAKRKTAGR